MGWMDLSTYVRVCSGVFEWVYLRKYLCMCIYMYISVYWCISVCIGVFQCVLVYFNVYWCI